MFVRSLVRSDRYNRSGGLVWISSLLPHSAHSRKNLSFSFRSRGWCPGMQVGRTAVFVPHVEHFK